MEEMKINIDKNLDLLTASYPDKKNNFRLEVIEIDYNILFHVNPETHEVIMIQIYDFSIIKRKLIKHLMFMVTKDSIRTWLNTLVASFGADRQKIVYSNS